ncbi:TPA: primosomal protein N' [Neisseria meningitidis]|jgi:replication restart DNA helicase PriA|uniref:Replication restart protein PriA n=2 Tax=Neisseria meningitidis serogroup B TaxID=491 RepID=Q9K0N6_NEIMB|nr:primosomal protein N' [Neisseria meningitidis]AJC62901.1 primosome assembly protein PriA [Neisseria meningitidis LNP21362]AAF40980.1 primosomal protein n` [Neisseria meningitidis MC58]ADY96216.1 primosomal protein N' [Neisseria meningitidis H44/76]ARC08350.1 primosomal protein N' [Neisseria meningitidis]EFV64362.1 primosomal protein N' [Neisseria meningitidis H44/76]
MIYHRIAVNVPLSDGLLTYSHSDPLPPGTRVLVPFRNKTVVGMVWETDIAPDMDMARILSVQTAFVEEKPLPESWRDLLAFTSRYYHYPTGQAVFAALPQGLKETRAVEMPQPPLFYALNEAGRAQTPPPARFNKKAALWDALLSGGMTMAALKQVNAQAAKLIEDWAEQGWIETTEAAKPVLRSYHGQASHSEFVLNADQQQASDEIQTAFGSFQPFLLYGITGSGKTEVYFDAMAKVLAQGRQVLFLLPEINLTPQLLKRVENRFADVPTAVLHSQMAAGKRTQDYLRAMLGQAKLVIGTRLAVFTPMDDVGLIVVDEEHDGSFKQDNELRYHARDLAVWRAKQGGCPIILGSATPSLESWHKAQSGAYRLLQLTERAHTAAQLPQVDILNVGRLKLDNGFSPQALQLLKQNFEAGGMSLVYLNRRGFAPALFCGDCGYTFGCPNCSAKMVLHQRARQLRCHHCDHREPIPYKCPDCGNQDLTAVGHGTQRVEETLRTFLPKAAVVRVDRDSTAHKNDWADLYRRIADNKIDILVGTQMLAKGHDFARLNLVIVLNADGSLYSADFRAPERLFAELMQVSGRAGRADKPGKVLIQTQLPEHPVFAAVKAQDYAVFAENELNERQMFAMPPFGFQTAVRADAPRVADAMEFLNAAKETLAPLLPESVSQFGAAPMLMVRLAERERAQIFLESPSRQDLHRAVSLWAQVLQQNRDGKIRWSVDVDPQEA